MRVPLPVRALPSVAYRAWFTPPPLPPSVARADAGATERLTAVRIAWEEGTDLTGFRMGSGPLVLALHGWGGRAAQFVPLAARLAGEDAEVVVIDLPGHAGGDPTDLIHTAAAVEAVLTALGPPSALVAHSFGSMALRLVEFDGPAPPTVLLAPLIRVTDALDAFAHRARLTRWVRGTLERRLRAAYSGLWPVMDGMGTDHLPSAPILVLHDPADPATPFARAADMAARSPATQMVAVAGAGHSGLLSHPGALHLVADFLSGQREAGVRVA
jgi:pimeloyl-ACP methyl ester carboxylesterase